MYIRYYPKLGKPVYSDACVRVLESNYVIKQSRNALLALSAHLSGVAGTNVVPGAAPARPEFGLGAGRLPLSSSGTAPGTPATDKCPPRKSVPGFNS
jgi:hypothetical protein